jgi:NAD(P)-dependent dehydrogenase (short-subunit alcohol dehydrogenase family)
MKVVLADVEEPALQAAAGALRDSGAEILAVVMDVSRAEDVDALAKASLEAFGAVHIVCNNAGVIRGGIAWEMSLADYEWHLGVNTWGVIHGIRSFIPIMIEQGEDAHMVNTSSQSGITCTPYSAAYCLSKHATVSLSECLYHDLALSGSKVKVSVLCPSAVATRIDESERNRPIPPEPASSRDSAVANLVSTALRAQLEKGITAEAMAEQTLQAIREDRFYVFTQGMGDSDVWNKNIETRFADVLQGRNPTFPAVS